MDECYLCGKEFNDDDVKKHDEHIIQQAIGGNLTAYDILCSSCGGKLGQEIDVPFMKILDGIATRLDIKKDRSGNGQNTKTVKGKMGYIDVAWKDFRVSPSKPFHLYTIDKTSVTIYANQQAAKKYRQKVENEINENLPNSQPEIIICDDIEGFVEFPFNMDNQAFKKGLAKIAIGFASSYGIQREDMPLVLNIDKNTNEAKIQDKILTIPFYPLGVIDELIEVQKNEFEHYPFHNLILFTIDYDPKTSKGKKVLICYIELFTTFQWYVVLNEEYYGDSIYKFYAQQILKKDDYIVELGRRYYKERNICLQPLEITKEYIEKKYNSREDRNKTCFEIEREIIQEETIKQKYKFDFESHMQNIISRISRQALIFKDKEKFSHINNDVTKFLSNENIVATYAGLFSNIEDYQNFKQNLDLFYKSDYEENEIFSIYSFKVFYYENDKFKNYYSELLENFQLLQKNGSFKDYHHKKMYMLEDYIFQENIKQKIKK